MRPLRIICAGAMALSALAAPAHAAAKPGRAVHRPQTRITAGPSNRVTVAVGARVRFAFAASVRGARFECSLDGRRFRACRSPAVYRGSRPDATASPCARSTRAAGPTARPRGARSRWQYAAPGARGAQTAWAPVRAAPLADAAAAALVTHRPEIRTGNAAANAYVPSDSELAPFHAAHDSYGEAESYFNPLRRYVTGRSKLANPSTDDLIQWTAHKWGIPEDVIRAQMAVESWWRQSAMGDLTSESNPGAFPAFSCPGGGPSCYESLGLAQDRWRPDASLNPGSEPLRWKSTAFNLDLYGANIRFYYDGYAAQWGPGMTANGYTAGQDWMSIGAHFNPYPWNNQGQRDYIGKVKDYLAQRIWTKPDFVSG